MMQSETVEADTPLAERTPSSDGGLVSARRRRRPRRLTRRTVSVVLTLVLGALDLVMAIAYARYMSIEAPTFHLDGSFQTASGLLRLKAGDLPGRDFFPYLGIGPVFLLFPVFILTGGVLTSSVFSAYLATVLLLALLAGVVFALALRVRSVAFVFGAAGVVLVILVLGSGRFTPLPQPVQAYLAPIFASGIPGNSLRPVRAAAPMLLVAVSVLALVRLPRRWGLVVIGVVSGCIGACWSNDFALVPTAVVVIFLLHLGIRTRGWRVRELATLLVTFVGGYLVSGFATTGGHFIEYATYNFRDVLGDQFWYFGAWSAKYRVYSVGDFAEFVLKLGAAWGVPLLVGLLVLVLVRPTLRWTGITAIGWAAFLGNSVAMIGGHFDDYFLPFRTWTVIAGVAVAAAVVRAGARTVLRGRARASGTTAPTRVLRVVGILAVTAVLIGGAVKEVHSWSAQHAFVAADTTQQYVPSLGGYLPASFAEHLASAPDEGSFVEEYAGLWTAVRGPNRGVKVDAVIHALGTERAPFVDYVAKGTDRVVTTAPQMSQEWVSWNMSANWWLYRDLFRHFTPTVTSPNTVVWKRAATTAAAVAGRCSVAVDGQSVVVTPGSIGLTELTLHYTGPGRSSRSFSMIRNNIDEAADANGFVALDPGATVQQVPLYANTLDPERFALKNVPARRLTTISSCSAASVPFPAGSSAFQIYGVFWAIDTTTFRLTDDNFLNGLYRNSAGFVVNRSMPNITAYKVGARVRLVDGEVRKVIATLPSFNVLLVYLDGPTLPQDLLKSTKAFEPVRSAG